MIPTHTFTLDEKIRTLLSLPCRDVYSDIPFIHCSTPLVLLGSGSVYAKTFVDFALHNLNVVAVIDNMSVGQVLGNLHVSGDKDIAKILQIYPNAIGVICCVSDNAIAHFMQEWHSTGQTVVNMFEVMRDNRYGENEYYYTHFQDRNLIQNIYDHCWKLFADPQSQHIFLGILLYRATLSQHWLEDIRQAYDDMYFFTSGLNANDQEIYVDVGSFDGDSIFQFLRRVDHRFGHIHAMEPDPSNFKILKKNFGQLLNCSLHNYGLWSQPLETNFQLAGLGSHMNNETGEVPVQLVALDDLALGEITLLKMDIEGAEVPALIGAKRTIERYKPKLAIAAYHKADDLPQLINSILAIRDDYVFTLSHHSPFFRDTVLMAH
jgi:FkbM family methyltransferase